MAMTAKDYRAIARGFFGARAFHSNPDTMDAFARMVIDGAAERVAASIASENPKFNAAHFMAVVRGQRPINSHPKRAK